MALGSSFVLVGLGGGLLPVVDQRHPHSQMSSVAEGMRLETRQRQNMFYSAELQSGTLERTRLDTDENHAQSPTVTVIHLKPPSCFHLGHFSIYVTNYGFFVTKYAGQTSFQLNLNGPSRPTCLCCLSFYPLVEDK